MRRAPLIQYLLVLSWPVNLIHRIWNNYAPYKANWFPFDDKVCDIQWYVHDLCGIISYCFIFLAAWLYINSLRNGFLTRGKAILRLFGTIFLLQFVDLPHYILFAKHSEVVLTLEGFAMIWVVVKNYYDYRHRI